MIFKTMLGICVRNVGNILTVFCLIEERENRPVVHTMLQDVSYFPNFFLFFTTAHGQQVLLGMINTFGSIHEILSLINWSLLDDLL